MRPKLVTAFAFASTTLSIVSVIICNYFLDFNKSQNAKMHKETTSDASRARLQILGKYEDI